MQGRKLFYAVLLLFCTFFLGAAEKTYAEVERSSLLDSNFQRNFPDTNLEEYVEFWRLVFTEYYSYHTVVHHRTHPNIIYSVLDFSDYEQSFSGKKLKALKKKIIQKEIDRVRSSLAFLAAGNSPRDSFEKRIERIFSYLKGDSRSHYREAMDDKQIRYQSGIKQRFEGGVRRSGRYLYAIEEIFRLEGLPVELSRLPLVESSFDYTAYSSVGAAGIWQFMRATGKRYMRINSYIDERKDPILASRAAAKYLANAHKVLGAWPLALTSYNHGVNGMLKARKKVGTTDMKTIIDKYDGRTFGFASKNFYVEFLAALEVEQNQKFYFPDLKRDEPWYFDEVELGRNSRFRDLVRASQIGKDEFIKLNPAILSPVIKGRARVPAGYMAKVPRGMGKGFISRLGHGRVHSLIGGNEVFVEAMSRSRKASSSSQRYKVRRGDTLSGIASKFGTTQSAILQFNHLSNANRIRAGQVIKIPGSASGYTVSKTSSASYSSSSRGSSTYRVKSGDALSLIAKQHGVSVASIVRANKLKNSRAIYAGQKLKIPGSSAATSSTSNASSENTSSSVTYKVKKGDALSTIARKYGVSVASIMRANNIQSSSKIYAGMKLKIPGGKRSGSKKNSSKKMLYKVRAGDNLSKIAKSFSTTTSRLKKLNKGLTANIQPGQEIVVGP